MLALLLAGSPGQFSRLIPDVESGLLSRLLLYTCRNAAVWQDVSPEGDGMDMEKLPDTFTLADTYALGEP